MGPIGHQTAGACIERHVARLRASGTIRRDCRRGVCNTQVCSNTIGELYVLVCARARIKADPVRQPSTGSDKRGRRGAHHMHRTIGSW